MYYAHLGIISEGSGHKAAQVLSDGIYREQINEKVTEKKTKAKNEEAVRLEHTLVVL
jgi:hypothetical protein